MDGIGGKGIAMTTDNGCDSASSKSCHALSSCERFSRKRFARVAFACTIYIIVVCACFFCSGIVDASFTKSATGTAFASPISDSSAIATASSTNSSAATTNLYVSAADPLFAQMCDMTVDEGEAFDVVAEVTETWGNVSYTWEVSHDGGNTWQPVDAPSTSTLHVPSAEVIDNRDTQYIYKLHIKDESGRMLDAYSHVLVKAKPNEQTLIEATSMSLSKQAASTDDDSSRYAQTGNALASVMPVAILLCTAFFVSFLTGLRISPRHTKRRP